MAQKVEPLGLPEAVSDSPGQHYLLMTQQGLKAQENIYSRAQGALGAFGCNVRFAKEHE